MKRALIIVALVGVVALPFALRPARPGLGKADETLVIITPHNEALRHEFTKGFREWYRARTGRTVAIDWRVIGGTSEINRYLESEYVASFQNHWTKRLGREWSNEVLAAFGDAAIKPDASEADDTPDEAARRAFLASAVGCGIDLFFGGGSYDYIKHAKAGRLVDSGIMKLRPEWFGEDVIPQSFTGEPYWDQDGLWVGDVLSSYGMVYNLDSLERLGIARAPRAWADLADPRLFGEVALCDPTKSSSIAKAFENVIQQEMQKALARIAGETGQPLAAVEARAVEEGWRAGLELIQRIGANARYFTDTSQKPPIDVMQGNSAVGMCIDFYGRVQDEVSGQRSGRKRLGYTSPPDGTVLSPDPIAMLRGAPNREAALAFMEFTLSMEGQKLWNFKPGAPGGPERYALRRLPIRRDFYVEEYKKHRSDPDDAPYQAENPLIYNAAWTGGVFREMAFVIRVMCLDTHPELAAAWKAIINAGQPPEALAAMADLGAVSYAETNGRIKRALGSKNRLEEITLANELANHFRRQYQRAAALATGVAD
jgi:ABC-type Fe3+ transport system substrate-binding protein